jgi:hypothetical protein
MKTKEEIEQLAQEWFLNDTSLPYGEEFGFIQGYNQCQEDMAIEIAELKIICQEYSKDVKALNDIINSLNKQNNNLRL